MIGKVQKIREEVKRLKSQLLRGACSSQIAMETMCKEEAYDEVLALLDAMQEEPVSGLDNGNMPIERWKQAVEAASNQRNYRSSKGLTETRDDYFVDGVQWADEHPKEEPVSDTQSPVVLYGLTGSVGNTKEEPQVKESAEIQHVNDMCKENGDSLTRETVSEVWHDAQTEQPQAKEKILATNEYGDCEVDFAINMALYWKKVIKWAYIDDLLNLSNVQRTVKNRNEPVNDELEKAAVEAFKQIVDSDKNNFLEIFKAGVKWQKEKMMAKAVDGVVTFDYYEGDKAYGCVAHDSFCLEDLGLKDMDEVKILILKKNKEL